MDETFIMNHVKESCCFVSLDVARDLETCRWVSFRSRYLTCRDWYRLAGQSNTIVQEYILPDLTRDRKGRIREPNDTLVNGDQILVLNNERFAVPEIIFKPDDLGWFHEMAK